MSSRTKLLPIHDRPASHGQQRDPDQQRPQAELEAAAFAFRRIGFRRLGLHGRIIPGRETPGQGSPSSSRRRAILTHSLRHTAGWQSGRLDIAGMDCQLVSNVGEYV
jgi:hypothetical protein